MLFLTTMGGIDDRVEGLEAGGDDYLVKPFAFSELLARINALARRPPIARRSRHSRRRGPGDGPAQAHRDRAPASGSSCSRASSSLLEYLMRHAGQVVTRTMLLEHVWDFHFDPQTNIVETHISRLRAKIDRGFGAELIQTVRGAGYCLRAPG